MALRIVSALSYLGGLKTDRAPINRPGRSGLSFLPYEHLDFIYNPNPINKSHENKNQNVNLINKSPVMRKSLQKVHQVRLMRVSGGLLLMVVRTMTRADEMRCRSFQLGFLLFVWGKSECRGTAEKNRKYCLICWFNLWNVNF